MSDTAAAGAQPHALPRIVSAYRAPPGNFHPGREGQAIRLFVRHNTETAQAGNAPSLSWFLSPASGVSIHHLVARNGWRYDLVYRQDCAYHTGVAAWGDLAGSLNGIALCNLVSLGMEFESSATRDGPGNGYTDAQLWTGAHCEACSLVSYAGLAVANHRDIALPPGRRADPSSFPLAIYAARVAAWVTWLRAVPDAEKARYCL